MNLFYNLKPIYKHTPNSDAGDYLMPRTTSTILMGCPEENSDEYESVIFDRSLLSSIVSTSTNL